MESTCSASAVFPTEVNPTNAGHDIWSSNDKAALAEHVLYNLANGPPTGLFSGRALGCIRESCSLKSPILENHTFRREAGPEMEASWFIVHERN